jgi:hypothetical protein
MVKPADLLPILLVFSVSGFAQGSGTKDHTLTEYPKEGTVYWRAGEVREGPNYYHYNQGPDGWTCDVDRVGHHVNCSKDDSGGIEVLGDNLDHGPTLVLEGEHGHYYTPNVLLALINGGEEPPTRIKIAEKQFVNAWKFHYRLLPDEHLGTDLIVKLFCTPVFDKNAKIIDEACYKTVSETRKFIKLN